MSSFLLESFLTPKMIVTYITIAFVVLFIIFLAIFLVKDYKHVKNDEFRDLLYKNSQKLLKHDVTTVYTDKSKNFSGTEILPIPIKPPTKECHYEFAGWDKNYFNESGDTIVKAVFIKIPNTYVVNFYSDDRNTLLKSVEVPYGSSADYSDIKPTKDETNEFSFEFECWSKDVSNICDDENVYAVFKAYPKKYTYTFLDSDLKTIVLQETAIYGTPVKLPNKPTPPNSSLRFSYWENYIYEMPLKKDETFVAVYKEKNEDEKVSEDILDNTNENLVVNEGEFIENKDETLETPNLAEDTLEDLEIENTENKSEDKIYEEILDILNENNEEDDEDEIVKESELIENSREFENVEDSEKLNNKLETVLGKTSGGDDFSYDDNEVYEEYAEEFEYPIEEFSSIKDEINNSDLVNETPKIHIMQNSFLNQYDVSEPTQEKEISKEPAKKSTSAIEVKQKVNNNNEPLYGLSGIMNPKMMVQNGYNLNNLGKDNISTGNKKSSININQSEKVSYNKINKTEKIIYNSVVSNDNLQVDKKVINSANSKGQNILFNNNRVVNNGNLKQNKSLEKEIVNNEVLKNNISNINTKKSGFMTDINSYIMGSENIIKSNIKTNLVDDGTTFSSDNVESKLTSFETFEDEKDGDILPKISVISAKRKTDANRKVYSQNDHQTTIMVRENNKKTNGAIFNSIINENDYKTIKTNVSNLNKVNSKNDVDDNHLFGTILVNHKNTK